MRRISDLRDKRSKDRLDDFEIELLLRRTPTMSEEHADLEIFVAAMFRSAKRPADAGHMATALAATARSTRRSPRRAMRRVMALAASVAVLFALSGVALAADGAVPGDLLYGVDRAMERIGIGDGGVGERIVEFDALIDRGQHQEAFDMLDEFAESASGAEASRALRHIDLAADKSNVIAAAAQEKAAAKKQFIEDNQGDDGVDGRDFGQGVSDRAQSSGQSGDQPGNSATQGPPDHASSGSDDNPSGQSTDREPPDQGSDQSSSAPGGDHGGGGSDSGGNSRGQSQNASQKDR